MYNIIGKTTKDGTRSIKGIATKSFAWEVAIKLTNCAEIQRVVIVNLDNGKQIKIKK